MERVRRGGAHPIDRREGNVKVLWYSDFACNSGFARVAHELVGRLDMSPDYQFHVLGINHQGEPLSESRSLYRQFANIPVFPAERYRGEPLGERRLLELLAQNRYDLLFALRNPWHMQPMRQALRSVLLAKRTRYALYFPIEQACDPKWVSESIALADRPIAYTHMGAAAVAQVSPIQCDVLYHGVNTKTFRPWRGAGRKEYREKLWGVADDELVILNVNRNQHRKDLGKSVLVAQQVCRELGRPVTLHLHCHPRDPAGHDLRAFVARWVDEPRLRVHFGRADGDATDAQLARLYGAADIMLTTAWCEGWGLSTTEAMACGLPVVAPRTSVFPELLGEGTRGRLADCVGQAMLPDQTDLFAVPSVPHLVDEVLYTVDNPKPTKRNTDAARAWVKEHCDWGAIALQLDNMLTETVCG